MDFAPENMLGEGGFGTVFKGYVDLTTFAPASSDTGVPIAIKKLNQGAHQHQGHKEWLVGRTTDVVEEQVLNSDRGSWSGNSGQPRRLHLGVLH